MEESNNRLWQMDSYLLGASVNEALELKEKRSLHAMLLEHGYRPNDEVYMNTVQLQHNVKTLRDDLSRTN
jgi:hypothetical protein